MTKANPVFEKHYEDYLRQLNDVDLPVCAPFLDITVDDTKKTVAIPFFESAYWVSPFGVMDDRGQRPDYGVCAVLLKYLLKCPRQIPAEMDWVSYRDFKDAGQAQDKGLSAYAALAISKRYAGRLSQLKKAVEMLGERAPETDYRYDLAAVLPALPRVPVLSRSTMRTNSLKPRRPFYTNDGPSAFGMPSAGSWSNGICSNIGKGLNAE